MKSVELLLPNSCLNCGACCSNPTDPKWVEVTCKDALKLPPNSYSIGDVTDYAMKQDLNGRCINLLGEVGKSCFCSIYESRPQICRQVQRFDEICIASVLTHKLIVNSRNP